jgi:sphingomyelin phosphodiesterase
LQQSKRATPPSDSKPLKIVHITDVHYDPNYKVGSNTNCGAPICCRRKQGKASNPQNGAGHWGDYRDCDMPLETIASAFDDIRQRHPDVDLIYFTGDVIDHGLWETSVEYNQNVYAVVHQLMVDMFSNTPVYWILGNHEAHPVNEFAPDFVTEAKLTSQWIYDMAAEKWSNWLPDHTQPTIRKGGYYTVLLQDGLRLVAINNNDCNIYNFWIMLDPQYLVKQLQWLHDTLLEAEFNGEKVHLLAHIPSGEYDAFKVWVREYRFILDRFWDTIVAQFVGHTHFSTFNVYYSRENPDLAIGQVWNGGSISTYSHLNSNYNVYSVDAGSFVS